MKEKDIGNFIPKLNYTFKMRSGKVAEIRRVLKEAGVSEGAVYFVNGKVKLLWKGAYMNGIERMRQLIANSEIVFENECLRREFTDELQRGTRNNDEEKD